MVAHTFDSSTLEAEIGWSLNSMPTQCTDRVLGQSGLYREAMFGGGGEAITSKQTNKENRKKVIN